MSKYGELVWKHALTWEQRLDAAVTDFVIKNASQLKLGDWVYIRSNAEYGVTDSQIFYTLQDDKDFKVWEADYSYRVKFVGLPF